MSRLCHNFILVDSFICSALIYRATVHLVLQINAFRSSYRFSILSSPPAPIVIQFGLQVNACERLALFGMTSSSVLVLGGRREKRVLTTSQRHSLIMSSFCCGGRHCEVVEAHCLCRYFHHAATKLLLLLQSLFVVQMVNELFTD